MVFDQAQGPRLGQRVPVESTYVRMFAGGEVPEAAWPGQLIFIIEEQILQIYDGQAWKDVTGGDLGQLTFVGPTPPTAQHVGDVWYNTSDSNRQYVAKSVGADQIVSGEWELVSAAPPPITPTTHIFQQDNPPIATDVPAPKNNDFWYETPGNHQYYYLSTAPGTHWVYVKDTGIDAAQNAADGAQNSANNANTAAGNAQNTANSKIKTFYATSAPTSVSIGDIWFDTANGNKQYRAAAANISIIGAGGWVLVQDTAIAAAATAANQANTAASNAMTAAQQAQATADGNVTTYYLADPPWPNGTTGKANNAGDMWFDTDTSQAYRWNDGTKNWDLIQDNTIAAALAAAQNAQTTADGKITAWYGIGAPWAAGLTTHDLDFGDIWYDTDDKNHPYYWSSGRQWVDVRDGTIADAQVVAGQALSNAQSKTKAFYQGRTTVGIPVAITVGDIWYDTDDNNHPYYASVIGANAIAVTPANGWWDAKDPNIDLTTALSNDNKANIDANTSSITDLDTSLENVQITAVSAQNSADTADGRVSMSDYIPGPDDVTFDQVQLQVDENTGLLTEVTVQVPRANGSIWFMRTRPRQNLCNNPSFETGATTNWGGGNLTNITTVTASPAVDGTKVAQLTNTAGAVNHYFQWSPSGRQPCVEGQDYTAAGYCKLVSGHGLGMYASIVWYDSTGVPLAVGNTVNGDPVDLIVGGVVQDWQRPWVTATAPTGAVTFNCRINSPAGNVSDVWQVDAMQVEASAELGRYFDGDSYDGSWDDLTKVNLCTSSLEGDKIIQVYELHDQDWTRKYFTDDTMWFLDAAKLIGTLDAAIITDNTIAPDKAIVAKVLASQTLVAGDLVNIWNSNGVFQMQKACAAPGQNYEVHGFVLDPVPSGTFGLVYHAGYNPYQTNLSPGLQWLSATPGKIAKSPPTAVGSLVQRVGYAPSATVLDFQPVQSIKIT